MEVNVETERLILRRHKWEDLNDIYEYLSDEQTVHYEPYKPKSIEETEDELKWRISTEEMIAVEEKTSGKVIGNIYLGKRGNFAIEMGFVFNRNFWGKGYAKESCLAAIEYLFSNGIHRVYAECDPQNANSWHLLEAMGFVKEAYFKENIFFWKDNNGNPIWKDTYVYSILNK